MDGESGEAIEARNLLLRLDVIDPSRFAIAGSYVRFDERSRNNLKDIRQRIASEIATPAPAPCNILIWGAPGSGKSFLIQEFAKELGPRVRYVELNLAQLDRKAFQDGLDAASKSDRPMLCLVDEVDAKSGEPWAYELLLPYLEPPAPPRNPIVYCLVGSGGKSLDEMQERIRQRSKGTDLLSRVPRGNKFMIDPLGIGDRILVSALQLRDRAWEAGKKVREIEKMALLYVAVQPGLSSPRQLRGLALQCSQRIPVGEDRIRYDHLFPAGDPENKEFWERVGKFREGLSGAFIPITGPPPAEPSPSHAAPETSSTLRNPAPDLHRIAVLPLTNISPDPKDEYIADGLTEEIVSVLSRVGGLRVISRTSIGQYKGTTKSAMEIGRELSVGSILEGSVRKSGNRVRISLQLIDASSDEHRWAQTFDRTLEDIFAVQAEVAEQTAQRLQVEVLSSEKKSIRKEPTQDTEAYVLYLQGVRANIKWRETQEPSDERKAAGFFDEAMAKDPSFSLAYASLANLLLESGGMVRSMKDVLPRVRELVARALELDPDSAEAHAARGNLAMQADQDWAGAEAEFQRALSLNPSNVTVHLWYYLLLLALQRFDEARIEARAALDLDPLTFYPKVLVFLVEMQSGNLSGAISEVEKLRTFFGKSPFLRYLQAWCCARVGHREEGLRLIADQKGSPQLFIRRYFAPVFALLGDSEESTRLLRDWASGSLSGYIPLYEVARWYAQTGQMEKAMELLERDVREGDKGFWVSYFYEEFDPLRGDPRFLELLQKMKLPTVPPRKDPPSQIISLPWDLPSGA